MSIEALNFGFTVSTWALLTFMLMTAPDTECQDPTITPTDDGCVLIEHGINAWAWCPEDK